MPALPDESHQQPRADAPLGGGDSRGAGQEAPSSSLEQPSEQSDWLRITLGSIGDAVISTNSQGQVTLINRAAELLTGWSEKEALGRQLDEVFSIVHERTQEPVANPAARTIDEGTVLGSANFTQLIARNGTRRPIDFSASPIRSNAGRHIGAVLVFRDGTGRKEGEEALARLGAIVESSDDAIVSKTLDGVIRSWNAGAQRVFGYTPEEAIGRQISLIIPPERMDEERGILARISRGERVEHFETVRVAKDGRLIDISLAVSPVRDGSGRIVGASKVARDITDRKRAEQAAIDADRRKDEFLALLAHELRNPLAPLRNGLQIMRLAGDDLGAMVQAREMMERQLGHMVRLIDDLLEISRISQNKLTLRRARVMLADVVASAVETARPAIEVGGHELTISLPAEPIPLDADLTRLAQVFSNLLTNSAKYTERGGHIWLTAQRRGDRIVVAVRDNGIGIPAGALPQIFAMFSQVDRSIERSRGGLGIGLALVKSLVEMHDGTVSAASEGPGRGSTFTVDLPVLVAAPGAPHVAPEGETLVRKGHRILVVDDNRDAADSMAMILRLLGNEVKAAHDGLEAISIAETFRPRAILMDLGMPKLNGYEATQRIRSQPWGREIMIVALTGWGQESDRALSKEAGCDRHLVKPVSLPDLEAVLKELQERDRG